MTFIAQSVKQVVCRKCRQPIDVLHKTPLSKVACDNCGTINPVPVLLDGYLISERIGNGTYGVIYKAWDREHEQYVAVKILHPPEVAGDAGKPRAIQKRIDQIMEEAHWLKTIHHPNVVRVFHIGRRSEQPFYVMEHLPNGSLRDRIRPHFGMDEVEALQIVIGVADGLRAAQGYDLLHLDVKPANIMFDQRQTPKLLDFGYAWVVPMTKLSRRDVPGTPNFVAPELLRGFPADFQCDIYSLGATLYAMLVGEIPFHGQTIKEVLDARLNHPPPDPRIANPELHALTAKVVLRMLDEDPEQRHDSYESLIEALQAARNAVRRQRGAGHG